MRKTLAVALILSFEAFSATESLMLEDSIPSRFSVTASDHIIFSSARNDVDKTAPPTQLFLNEGKIKAEYGVWNGDIHFTNRYEPNPNQKTVPTINLEKKTIRYESKNWQVILGDSHQQLGRGMALSLFSEPAFGIDNTLEGGMAKYRPEGIELSVFGGRVNALKNPVAINPIDMRMKDRNVLMSGGSMSYKPGTDSQLGAYYLMTLNQRKSDLDLDDRFQTVGATFSQDNIGDEADFYAESSVMISDRASQGAWVRNPLARANYLSLSWSSAPWKIKMEAKDYDHFDFDFRKPPSLEEEVPLANVPNNFSDITAGKIYAEHMVLGSGTKIYSSVLLGRDRLEQGQLYHAVSGGKFSFGKSADLELKAGYRTVINHNNITHGSIKGKINTFTGQMAELEYKKQYSNLQLNISPSTEDRNSLLLTYTFSEGWSLSAGYEYIPTNDSETGKNFYNLGASYRKGSLTSRAFIGDTSGGAQCAGGVCRQAPAYSGAMLDATYMF